MIVIYDRCLHHDRIKELESKLSETSVKCEELEQKVNELTAANMVHFSIGSFIIVKV